MRLIKRLRGLCLAACLVAAVLPAFGGQQAASSPEQPPQPAAHAPKPSTLDERVKRLARALDLTDSQQVEVKKILVQRQQEMLRLRTDPNLTGSQRVEQFRALQDGTVERIRAILTDEQKKKYDPLAARKAQQANQPNVEDWLKPSPLN